MELQACIQNPWNVTKELKRTYSQRNVEKALGLFNRACHNNFFITDHREQKIIAGKTVISSLLYGYSKEVIEIEGFDFYERILDDEEKKWLTQLNKQAFSVFYNYPQSERWNLEFYFDLIANFPEKQNIILHHKLVPFKLDKNGNLWLGLCHITTSNTISVFNKARAVNIETGKQYDYLNEKFVESTTTALDTDEKIILTQMAKDMPNKQMADLLKISESSLKRKRLALFDKLEVKSPAAAVYKATLLNII